MILGFTPTMLYLVSIPRESGDDPTAADFSLTGSPYSPRERG